MSDSFNTCSPLENKPTIWWNSRQCCTAECPPGFTGPPSTACVEANTFSSTISQEDANAQAMRQACLLAQQGLSCIPEIITAEEADLLMSLSGTYQITPIPEESLLSLTLFGRYVLQPIAEEEDLAISLAGDYVLVPISETQSLGYAISPLSEYRLIPFFEFENLGVSVVGTYASAISPTGNGADTATVSIGLAGDYVATITATSAEDAGSLALSMAGDYVLRVQSAGIISESIPVAVSLIGAYTLTVQPVSAADGTTLGVGLLGTYS